VHGTLDIRHPNNEAVRDMLAEIRRRAERTAGGHDCVFEWTQAWLSEAVEFDSRVVRAVENACTKRRYPAIRLSSGAGHDAVHLSSVCPTGMVFVPSRDGISHSPREHTSFQDLAVGATVLAEVLVALASSEMAARKSW
jgi:N-carbamoyl-L-amino-acid hydrolase